MRMYANAHRNRVSPHDPKVLPLRMKLLKGAGLNFLLLQLLFLALFAYIFGALFQQSVHTHNLNILYVDYDGGIIGSAVRDAYRSLQGESFPTLQEQTPAQFATTGEMREAVCDGRYWAAIFTLSGASNRLSTALAGGQAASMYNRSDVITYIWNEAAYSAIVDSAITSNLQTLSTVSRLAYVAKNGTGALQTLTATDPIAISIFANPWQLTNINIQPTTQGSRLIYNTLVIILILIQEFFYLGTINGLYLQFKIYARLFPHRIIAYRNAISLAYTLIGSLCVAGMIWAFRAGWHVNGNQFALTWAILWLFAHVNFLALDIVTIWCPAQFIPMALITWVIINVTSILVPFELSNGFYRWGYALPAHEVYQVLVDIWSGGCNKKLHYALPILFSWEVLGLLLSAVGTYRRCHYAVITEEAAEVAFTARLNNAMEFERKRDREKRERERAGRGSDEDVVTKVETDDGEREADRVAMEDELKMQERELRKVQTRASKRGNYGPCFNLPFAEDTGSSTNLEGEEGK
ncbi:hypothetical protein BGZ60DRAFT_411588 [Tricladium varicosporioides]|nr:hypothetical protein BGZ60DRAFT_411588 [Hymenoscyphus varicosporioides]